MRRLLRILFNVTAFLSMLIFVAAVVLWVRSRTVIDYVHWSDHRHFPALVSSDGRMIYSYQFWSGGVGGSDGGFAMGSRPGDPPYWGREAGNFSRNYFAGFEWSPAAGEQRSDEFIGIYIPLPSTYVIAVPDWFVCLLACVPVFIWARGRRRHGRGDGCLCLVCGYDLRATPDRCPECGTVIAKAEGSAGQVKNG